MSIGYPDTKNKPNSPLLQTKEDIKKRKEYLKIAKENRKEYRKSKPWKKNESRTEDGKPQWYKEGNEWVESEQYETRSEHKASMLEEDEGVERNKAKLKAARKRYRKSKKNNK